MHFKDLAKLFNISNFFVYLCLLVFSILLSLRVDNVLSWHYAVVFLPLWLWDAVLGVSVSLGVGCWVKRKDARASIPGLCVEVLVVVNAESAEPASWTAIFIPMYILSFLSVAACILGCCIKHCNIEFELLSIASFLQLLFIGLRLDKITSWTWAVVLVPSWVTLVLLVVGLVVYGVIKYCAALTEENPETVRLAKPLTLLLLTTLTLATICVIVFMALLSARLDDLVSTSYSALFVPLHLSLLLLLTTTCSRDPANPWWLGLGKNFTEFILDTIPFVQEYANISHHRGYSDNDDDVQPTEMEPGHYDDLLSVDEPIRTIRVRTRQLAGSSKKSTPPAVPNTIPDDVYPFESLYEPD
ncbi:transmembrane protein 185-like isoform X2 [Halichondria panicea]|uniref:transmembrane protein 185-like isoform X2 n=1 Tax=Halichondria panicea TaxID=6063 RepID=UPI00312B3F34